MSRLRFYLDENINPVVAEQLVKHGIEAVSVRDLATLGDEDKDHLQRATAMGYVLCTHDQDFLQIASENTEHTGIVFAGHYGATIGGWVRALRELHHQTTAEAIYGLVVFVSVK